MRGKGKVGSQMGDKGLADEEQSKVRQNAQKPSTELNSFITASSGASIRP